MSQGTLTRLFFDAVEQYARHPAAFSRKVGGVWTPVTHREAEERGVTFEEIRDKEWGVIPLKVAGEPSVIADSVVFLSSPAASYITGASLDVNGGVLFH